MSLEVADLRTAAEKAVDKLAHPFYGLCAGIGPYDDLFARDVEEAIILVASNPFNLGHPLSYDTQSLFPSQFWQAAELSLDLLAQLQGQKVDPELTNPTCEDEGRILHEYRDSRYTRCPVLAKMVGEGVMPIKFYPPSAQYPEGFQILKTFFADDATPRFITAVQRLSLTKKPGNERGDYLTKMFGPIYKAFVYQSNVADIDQDGLVESDPSTNPHSNCQSERDSCNAYALEDGSNPQGIRRYLSNNYHNLAGHEAAETIYQELDLPDLAKEARARLEAGLEKAKIFWDPDKKYFTPLLYGDFQRVDFINDEAIDPLFYGFATDEQARAVAYRLSRPDFNKPYGQASRPTSSDQWYPNGKLSYWNGNIWFHRVGKAATAFERYGLYLDSEIKDQQLLALFDKKRLVETAASSRRGRLADYDEGEGPVACNPQLWAAAVAYARSALAIHLSTTLVAA